MPTTVELIGLLVTALLLGAFIGGFLVARSSKAARRAAHEEQCIQALIQWLAARRDWRRTATALVRAVRALAQEPRQSSRFKKKCQRARRSKKNFRVAMEQLTLAEAAMETWRGDALSRLAEPPPQPTSSQVRRAAMRGGADRIESLNRRLTLADKADLEWVRVERIQMRARRSVFAHLGVWAQRFVWKVVRMWDRPR